VEGTPGLENYGGKNLNKYFPYLVYIEVANSKQELQKPLRQNPTSKTILITSSNDLRMFF
jgi:hypothetical protein